MQSSINSFFKPKTTPEKSAKTNNNNNNATPTKVTPPAQSPKGKASPKPSKGDTSSPLKSPSSPSPPPSLKSNSPSSTTTTTTTTTKARSPPSSPSRSPSSSPSFSSSSSSSSSLASRKRKAPAEQEHEEDVNAEVEGPSKKIKEDPAPQRSFSNDALLDDDETLAALDLDTAPTKPTTVSQPKPGPSTTNPVASVSTPTKTSKIISMASKPAGVFGQPGATPDSVTRLMDLLTDESWKEVLKPEFKKPYFTNLAKFLEGERAIKNNRMYPPEPLIFNALNHASFDKVRVVIIGQDPYINKNQAMGFSFSVPQGVRPPPSLQNIFKELSSDIPSVPTPTHGDLTHWADQGVLLLNAVLTVREGESNSHKGKGWENLTSAVINAINLKKEGVVFIVWGRDAQNSAAGVNVNKHLVLKGTHPSPKSADRGFFGCKHFSKTNDYLQKHGKPIIDWKL